MNRDALNRRDALKLGGALTVGAAASPKEAEANPNNLPVAVFGDDDRLTNLEQLFSGVELKSVGWKPNGKIAQVRKTLVWVNKEDAVGSIGGNKEMPRWCELLLYQYFGSNKTYPNIQPRSYYFFEKSINTRYPQARKNYHVWEI